MENLKYFKLSLNLTKLKYRNLFRGKKKNSRKVQVYSAPCRLHSGQLREAEDWVLWRLGVPEAEKRPGTAV